MNKKNQGFTLTETIITLGVVSCVAATSLPVLQGFIGEARRQAAIMECRNAVQTATIAGIEQMTEGDKAMDTIRDEANVKGEICKVEWHDNGEIVCLIYRKGDITVTYAAESYQVVEKL